MYNKRPVRLAPGPRGPSRIGISYAFLRFWNLALAEKLCIPLNILGFYISINLIWNLESLSKNCGIRNLVQKFSWCRRDPLTRPLLGPRPDMHLQKSVHTFREILKSSCHAVYRDSGKSLENSLSGCISFSSLLPD